MIYTGSDMDILLQNKLVKQLQELVWEVEKFLTVKVTTKMYRSNYMKEMVKKANEIVTTYNKEHGTNVESFKNYKRIEKFLSAEYNKIYDEIYRSRNKVKS